MSVSLVLLVFGFVCFVMAAFWNPSPPRVNLGWLGLAFWILAEVLKNTIR